MLDLIFPPKPGDVVGASYPDDRSGCFGIKGSSLVIRQVIDDKPCFTCLYADRRMPFLILRLIDKRVDDQPRVFRDLDRAAIVEQDDNEGFFPGDDDII